MEFIQQLAEVDHDDSMAGDDQEEEEKVRHQSDDNFINDGNNFQDQDAQAYRITNTTRDLQETLKDKSISEKLGLCSDPGNYAPGCFVEVDYNFDDFKGFEKRIKKFVDELKITEVGSRDSLAVYIEGEMVVAYDREDDFEGGTYFAVLWLVKEILKPCSIP